MAATALSTGHTVLRKRSRHARHDKKALAHATGKSHQCQSITPLPDSPFNRYDRGNWCSIDAPTNSDYMDRAQVAVDAGDYNATTNLCVGGTFDGLILPAANTLGFEVFFTVSVAGTLSTAVNAPEIDTQAVSISDLLVVKPTPGWVINP